MEIPIAFNYDEEKLLRMIEKSSTMKGLVALCLGARHCNGFIRENASPFL